MEDKYYVPKIEEFHVGFEYEQHEIINERDPHWKMMVKKMGFSKKEINQMFYNVDLVDNLDQKRIRVKYLDSSDIESLGFDQTIEDQYYKDDFELLIDDDLFIQIIKDDGFIFQGTIKNKSEFKKLLIQTGIINE